MTKVKELVVDSITVDGVRYDLTVTVEQYLATIKFLNENLKRRGE
jgi:hypothetical protein